MITSLIETTIIYRQSFLSLKYNTPEQASKSVLFCLIRKKKSIMIDDAIRVVYK